MSNVEIDAVTYRIYNLKPSLSLLRGNQSKVFKKRITLQHGFLKRRISTVS